MLIIMIVHALLYTMLLFPFAMDDGACILFSHVVLNYLTLGLVWILVSVSEKSLGLGHGLDKNISCTSLGRTGEMMGWPAKLSSSGTRIANRPSVVLTVRPRLLLMTNRKLHTRFRLLPKSMTLDDLERPFRILFQNICVFGAHHENFKTNRPILLAAGM